MQNSGKNDVLTKEELLNLGIIANDSLEKNALEFAENLLKQIHIKTQNAINEGRGPFYAEIYDAEGNFISSASNSVIIDKMATRHAEINAIEEAHKKIGDFDLGKRNLTVYVNAEPCVMCMGAIMWSGIKKVFYSVPSVEVEAITGFDEGYKPKWQAEFKKRGISVYGNIAAAEGKAVLAHYVNSGKNIYKPTR